LFRPFRRTRYIDAHSHVSLSRRWFGCVRRALEGVSGARVYVVCARARLAKLSVAAACFCQGHNVAMIVSQCSRFVSLMADSRVSFCVAKSSAYANLRADGDVSRRLLMFTYLRSSFRSQRCGPARATRRTRVSASGRLRVGSRTCVGAPIDPLRRC
jgi:hypothetical protein